jgi:hypothetical protein
MFFELKAKGEGNIPLITAQLKTRVLSVSHPQLGVFRRVYLWIVFRLHPTPWVAWRDLKLDRLFSE